MNASMSSAKFTRAYPSAGLSASPWPLRTDDPDNQMYEGSYWKRGYFGGDYEFLLDGEGGERNLDARTTFFYMATLNTPAMAAQMIGVGSQYAWDSRDSAGGYLDGAKSYRLNLPANAPAKNFWSVVAYDPQTRSELQIGQPFPSKNSVRGDLTLNPDGSVDLYFGPHPQDGSENNWVRPSPAKDGSPASVSTVPSNHGSTRLGGQARSSWSPTAQRKCRGSRSPWPLGLTADSARCGSVSKPPGPRPDHDLYRISAIECVCRLVRAPNRLAEDSHPGAPQTARIRFRLTGRGLFCAQVLRRRQHGLAEPKRNHRVESTCACQPSLSMRARSSSASYMTLTTRYSEPSPRRRR